MASIDPSASALVSAARRTSRLKSLVAGSTAAAINCLSASALDRYLAKPASDTVLVLVAPGGSKLDKALLDRTTPVEFEPLNGERTLAWMTNHAATALGATLTVEGARLLHEAVGSDLSQANVELEKLAAYAGTKAIDADAVEAVVGIRRGATLSSLLDAIGRKDGGAASNLVSLVLEQPKTSGVSIVIALTAQVIGTGWVRARRDRGMPKARLYKDVMGLLKETGAFPMRPWGEAAQCWIDASDQWTQADVASGIDRLLSVDRALKDTRVSSDEQIITSLVLGLCVEAGTGALA